MPYIEKDREGEFFNPVSNTVQVNPRDCDCGCSGDGTTNPTTDNEFNLKRWSWLINEWDEMTFAERAALFTPYIRVIRLYNTSAADFDSKINEEISDTVINKCRTFSEIKYDEDHHGSPCFTIIFNPIDVDSIPNTTVRISVRIWGQTYGFLKSDASTTSTSCSVCGR